MAKHKKFITAVVATIALFSNASVLYGATTTEITATSPQENVTEVTTQGPQQSTTPISLTGAQQTTTTIRVTAISSSEQQQNSTVISTETQFQNSTVFPSHSESQQPSQNIQSNGSLLQSLLPTISNILKSYLSGTNKTIQSGQLAAFMGNLLSGVNVSGNGSVFAATEFGTLEAAVEKYLNEPIVESAILPVMIPVLNILKDEITKKNNGTFPPLLALPSALAGISSTAVLQRLVQARVPQKLLQSLPHGKVQDACYRDTVDTVESLLSFKKWALDMFDATGKVESGIQKGHFYFIGSYDQCYEAKPLVETVYPDGRTSTRSFGTHFCRADIGIPDSLIKSLNVDTRGVKLKLTWGLCVPDSCRSKDVKAFFEIGKSSNISLPIEKVYCYEDEDLSSDSSAIAAICILSVIALLITSGTLIDACRAYYSKPDKSPKPSQAGESPSGKYIPSTESNGFYLTKHAKTPETKEPVMLVSVHTDVGMENGNIGNGEIQENKTDTELPLPPGYVEHRETGIEIVKAGESERKTFTRPSQPSAQKDNLTKKTKDNLVVRLLLCFSFYTNIPKILHAKGSRGSIACIHGIRFFSLTWVVLGHTYNYGVISMEETLNAANLLDFVGILQRFTYQTVVAGGFAVDTFFVLSAFLLTWLHLKDKSKKKNKCALWDSIYFYFHRFWRLTPIYMFVLMAFACLYKYLGSGPMWPSSITTAENCKDYWWTNLLYVNNLVHLDNQCMGWTWYLANDMQFYVISPIFLLAMLVSPVFGAIFTGILLAVGMTCAFWKEYVYNGNFFTMKEDGGDYWRQVYIVPWCRVGCWAVGMLLGFLVFRRGEKPLRNKVVIRLGWLVATAIALFLVYIPYTEQKKDGQTWTRVERAFYEGFGRPAWGACIAWVIFACFFGKGGIVNTILSWNGFIPLSRLTYAAYLVHPICMMVNVWSRRTLLYVNDYTIIYLFLGHLCITYMVAFVCSLAFEAPFMALEKILFLRGRRR